jgi:hypothetical protein
MPPICRNTDPLCNGSEISFDQVKVLKYIGEPADSYDIAAQKSKREEGKG